MPIIAALPVTLTNGTPDDSTQVMADFNWILSQVNANGAPLTSLSNYLPLTGGTLSGPGNLVLAGSLIATQTAGITGTAGSFRIFSLLTGPNPRWELFADNASESGGNVGSNFGLNSFNDAGSFLANILTVTRSTSASVFGGTLAATANLSVQGPAATFRTVQWSTFASGRWQAICGNIAETGGNAGSNFQFQALDDSGAFLGLVWTASRATQVVTFAQAIVNGPSDRTLKENIAPLAGSLAKVRQLQGVSFNFIGNETPQIGLIAQDVAPIVPEVLQTYQMADETPKLALDYPKLVAHLIEAIKELSARVEALEQKA